MKKKIVLGLVLLILIGGGIIGWSYYSSHKGVQEAPQAAQIKPPEETNTNPDKIRIVAVGDMLPHDSINAAAKTGDSYDYTPLLSEVTQYLDGGDVTYCNQESPSAEDLGVSGYPTFNAPTEFSRDMQKSGCNVINLANNHIADKGQPGIDGTLQTWRALKPLAFAGANSTPQEQVQPRYFEVNGIKFAFIAFTDLSNNMDIPEHSVNMFSNDMVAKVASEASRNADYVIASAHWGVEDSETVTPAQRGWAQVMADNGVDLILGEGPHVLQPVEMVTATGGREVPVWYSLGNFLSSQLEVNQLIGGMAVIDFDISGGKMEMEKMSFMPTYMHYEWTPEQAAAEDLLARTNLKLYPLANATEPMSKSQLSTTVEEQTARVTGLLNSSTEVTIITPEQY